MNNSRQILIQILDITGSSSGKEKDVDDFLTMIEVQVLAGLIESLPADKHNKIIDQWIALPDTPQKAENILQPYFTREHMRETLKKATKKAIAQLIVESHSPSLSTSQRDSILALLDKLTC